MSTLTIGEKAPDFRLTASNGEQVALSDYIGKQVVLYFYPRNMTPTCTQQACQLRDYHSEFANYNTVVLGVSTDAIKSHQRFIAKHELPFLLLADEEHVVAEQYGVWQLKKLYGKEYMGLVRSTFLIDTNGVLAGVWPKVRLKGHVDEVLEAAKVLANGTN